MWINIYHELHENANIDYNKLMSNIKQTTKNKIKELELEDKIREFLIKYFDKVEVKDKCKIYFNYDLTVKIRR